jgi:RuvA, C-terminal domain
MTPKTATRNLYVSLARLLTGLVDLASHTVRLGVAVLAWAIRAVERRTSSVSVDPQRAMKRSLIQRAPIATVAESTQEETLTNALVGLGFRVPEVRRFVSSVGPRAAVEPMADLIKEGLRALAS